MRILFLADNFPPERNAQASRVYERACYWVKWGCDVTVITCAPNFPEGRLFEGYRNRWRQVEEISGIRVVRVKTFIAANEGKGRRILDFLSFMVAAFGAGLLEERPDVVVATSPQFFAAVGGWALARARRLPFVMELSDLWPASITAVGAMRESFALRMMQKVEFFLYRQSRRVVALTYAFREDLVRRGIPEERVDVVRNGAELSRYHPAPRDAALRARLGIEPDDFVVGYIGTHGMAHGLENALAAAELAAGGRIKFMFVGGGAERKKLVAEAERKALTNVIFVPLQPKEAMPAFWGICDVALIHLKDHPVFKTVIPSKIFEAMAMGLPILIAAPAGEATGIIESEGVGLVAPAGQPEALAEAAVTLYGNPALRARFSQQCRRSVLRFTRERQAALMLEALETAIGAPQKRAQAAGGA